MQEKFSALIVEDANINIKLLTVLLEKFCPNIDVVGVAKNTEEFIDLLLSLKPDILLLDIDLGEDKNTLDILNEVDNLNCEIIITSSHVDFAIKAINEYHVSGYIVKPINSITLTKSVNTAVNSILQKKAWLSKESNNGVSDKILAIPTSTSIEFIETNDIIIVHNRSKIVCSLF